MERRESMRVWMLPCVVGIVTGINWPSQAQEALVPDPLQIAPAPAALPPEAPPESCAAGHDRSADRILWAERGVPVQTLVPREVITERREPALEVAYREEKRVFTEMVVKEREVEKDVPCTTMQPVTELDPHTHCLVTVLKPVTQVRRVKDMVFSVVPEERVEMVKIPYLRRVEEVVPRRTLILEYRTEMQRQEYPVPIPCGSVVPQDRVLLVPKVPLPDLHTHLHFDQPTPSPIPAELPPKKGEQPPESHPGGAAGREAVMGRREGG
jgi:hypothetical protein